MPKFRSIPYAVLTGSLLVSGGAYAQSMSSIDQRQDYQQDRIERGIQSGQITRSEAARLEQGERAIDRAQARARADGVVTQQERARIDRMTDRESRDIYRQSHDSQQAWDRGQQWGHTDGRQDGWRDRDGRQNGWGQNNGQHDGWARGEHNGWDGNRPPGIERRDARQDQRIQNGVRDGSLTHGEANRLERGQDHINRYEARARSDGAVTPQEHNRINQMQNNESRRIYADRHNDRTAPTTPTTPATGSQSSHNWGNGGWSHQQQASNTPPATATQPVQQPSRSWGGARTQQASATPATPATPPATATQPAQQPSRSWSNGGARMQQASATTATPRPTYTPTSTPSSSRSRSR